MPHAFVAAVSLALAASTLHAAPRLAPATLPGDRGSPAAPTRETPPPPDRVLPNDNRRPAGTVRGGVLTLRLEARIAAWQPEPDGPALPVYAFAEEGRAPLIPGPLVRVGAGTEVRATVRNTLTKAMVVRGLQDRPSATLAAVEIAPGASREFVFRATTPGTYYYWGRTAGDRERLGVGEDSQLLGALVVDSAGVAAPRDRVWVMGLWIDLADTVRGPEYRPRETMVMNGLAWPHTERIAQTVGDTVRWRVINANPRRHPMHLHGFYFTVDARGTPTADTVYTREARRLAVTELMNPGGTMAFTWVPTRAGNWLFHCHLIAHVSPELKLRAADVPTVAAAPAAVVAPVAHRPDAAHASAAHRPGAAMNHARDGMAGLVVGIHVRPRRGARAVARDPVPRRALRLFVNERARVYDTMPGYSYVLQEGPVAPAADSLRVPGSPIVLTRGEPTEITVVNRSARPATVHWHGIELESFYDGVGDWSGWGTRTAPPIAPGDSFVVRLTPDRAGTFIYHTHSEEGPQLASGLYGPLLILAPGAARDTVTDRILLLGVRGPGRDAPPAVNGDTAPPPLALRAGTMYRLRFINITPSHFRDVRLLADSAVQRWRPFAKDGADLPAHQAAPRPAQVTMGAGETYDYEFTPASPGTLTMEIVSRGLGRPPRTMRVPVVVTP
jgi:FtsP/CotA-like multicopper oxidase with cupredoxin domain